jgi:hypothetical protein|tara:strand:- start:94 stop:333 length:240 start_codon:yes stop_codon:yes gene_type:complete
MTAASKLCVFSDNQGTFALDVNGRFLDFIAGRVTHIDLSADRYFVPDNGPVSDSGNFASDPGGPRQPSAVSGTGKRLSR